MKILAALVFSLIAMAHSGQDVFNAAESQDWKKLETLVKKNKALANAKDAEGQTILMVVANLNSPKTVEFLLKNGADTKAVDSTGANALMNAISNADVATTKVLWNDEAAKVVNKDEKTVLILAAEANSKDIIELVLPKTKSLLEMKDKAGNTPLLAAVQSANPDATRALVKAGANVNVKNSSGKTAVQLAKELGLKETLQALQNK